MTATTDIIRANLYINLLIIAFVLGGFIPSRLKSQDSSKFKVIKYKTIKFSTDSSFKSSVDSIKKNIDTVKVIQGQTAAILKNTNLQNKRNLSDLTYIKNVIKSDTVVVIIIPPTENEEVKKDEIVIPIVENKVDSIKEIKPDIEVRKVEPLTLKKRLFKWFPFKRNRHEIK